MSEVKRCPLCSREMIAKPLFTSVYYECPRCDAPRKTPSVKPTLDEYDDEPYIIPTPMDDSYPDWNSKARTVGKSPALAAPYGLPRTILKDPYEWPLTKTPENRSYIHDFEKGDIVRTGNLSYSIPVAGMWEIEVRYMKSLGKIVEELFCRQFGRAESRSARRRHHVSRTIYNPTYGKFSAWPSTYTPKEQRSLPDPNGRDCPEIWELAVLSTLPVWAMMASSPYDDTPVRVKKKLFNRMKLAFRDDYGNIFVSFDWKLKE